MLAAGTALGPYKILALLGAGGMGEVYRARDTRLGRDVALKVIPTELARNPDRIKRFEQEARAAGALNHPNVCAIFDIGTHEGSPFVVMELLEGESLRSRLNQGPIPVRKAIDWAAQAANGLAAAHEKGIVHRDLKPENLFLTKDGRLKVLDFGLAKLTRPEVLAPPGESPVSAAPTETGAILGTAGYMAPEQVRGQPADHRADLFALGTILYEFLTGKRAFPGVAFYETTYRILNDEPLPLADAGRDISPGLETVVWHCLEKNPEERFQTARDLAFALVTLGGAELPVAAVTPPVLKSARSLRGARMLAAVMLVFAGLGVAAAMFWARKVERENAPARVTYQRLTAQRGRLYNARFSPEGKTVFYAASWQGSPIEIFETRPGLFTSRSLGLPPMNLLSVSRDGMMAVTIGDEVCILHSTHVGILAEVSISGGTPRALMDSVLAAGWSSDGKTLAVARASGGKTRLEMPPGRTLYESPGDLRYVRVSPSGKLVAFHENYTPLGLEGNVTIIDVNGQVVVRSGQVPSLTGIAWSADGSEIWFSLSSDWVSCDIMAMDLRGRKRLVHRLLGMAVLHDIAPDGEVLLARQSVQAGIRGRRSPADEERELGFLDWSGLADVSTDGQTILFTEGAMGGGTDLSAVYVRGTDGSPPVRLGDGIPWTLSPDGKWALTLKLSPPKQIILLPTGVGAPRALPSGGIITYSEANRSRWLPDGNGIVFVGAESNRSMRTYIQDIKGGDPHAVTPEGFTLEFVLPDGRSLLLRGPGSQYYMCPLNGGEPRPIAHQLPYEYTVQISPDGQVAYLCIMGRSLSIVKLDLRDGNRALWRTFSLPDPSGVMMMGGMPTADTRSYAYCYSRILDDLFIVRGLK